MASPTGSIRLNNPEDPKEVLEALKKEGIASLDDLIKNAIETQKRQAAGVHKDHVYKDSMSNIFWF